MRRNIILACHLRHDRAGRIGFRHQSSLGLVTPATPTPHPHPDIDPATYPRSFNYMANHICDSTSRMWASSCRSSRALQGGGGEPLTPVWQSAGKDQQPLPARRTDRGARDMKYTDVAATYDKLFKDNASAQIWENINDGEPLTIVKTLEHFVTSGDVLDIGAGVGHYSIYLASRGFNVLATDISSVAIERLEARAKAKGVSIHTRFHDIADQELEHEFDVIICAAVLHHLRTDDALSVINKIQDHTKPMG